MKLSKQFCKRLLAVILYLTEKICPSEIAETEVLFNQIRFNGFLVKGEINKMELREGQQFTVSASLKTKSGNNAAYENGSASWESSDPAIASVEVNPENELEATVKGLDGSSNGSAIVTFRADGDPDADETRDVVGTLDVVVTQGEAVVVELSAGEVTDSE